MSDRLPHGAAAADERAAALLDDVARLSRTARGRTSAALDDLFRPAEWRLGDRDRAVMAELLARILAAVEDELRSRLLARGELPDSEGFAASIGAAHVDIAMPVLERSGLLRDRGLVAALLRRSEEYRIGTRLRAAATVSEDGRLDRLLDSADERLVAAATALLIAESRRNDRFDEPVLAHSELPAPLHERLVWWVAAALRDYGVRHHGLDPGALDRALARAAAEAIASHDAETALEACALRLAGLLAEDEGLTDGLLVEALSGARLALYVAMLAVRADLAWDAAWELATDPRGAGHAVLLRAIGVGREEGIRLAISMRQTAFAEPADDDPFAGVAEAWDSLSPEAAAAAVAGWRLDPGYRDALADLAAGQGGPT